MKKPVVFAKQFEKHYAKRVLANKKLSDQFDKRFKQFMTGERNGSLKDHALGGSLKGKRAFSVTGDIRVIYLENQEQIIFLDVGTHAQVY